MRVTLRPTIIDQLNLMRQDAEARGMQVMACMFDAGYVDPSIAQSYAQQWAFTVEGYLDVGIYQ